MAKISTYPIISLPTFNDLLIGTDVENLNETKNFTIGDIADLIIVGNYVPYIGAIDDVDLGIHSITASSFIVPGGLSTEFVKADGSLDSTVYQPAGNYITGLSGEATASGPGVSAVVLSNGAVIGKVLTGLTITGGSISSSDSVLQAFGKLQNQVNGLYGGAIYQGTWNALTNTPTLTSSVGTQGYYYIVSVAGNTVLDGISDWNVGDWAIFDGTAWQQVDNTDTVVSVNGQVGIVVLTTTDIAEGTNLYYTDTRARASLTLTTTGSSGASTYNNLTGAFNIPNYTLSGLGGVPSSRQLSINGTAYDLSADRSWSVGTVTSIGTSGPLTGGTITGSGTIGITQSGAASDGYLSSTDWNIFNNKQNALVNPVTGTGTVYYIPMWSAVTALTDSIISYSSNVVNYNYNSASGATVNYINTNGTAYTYTIQMNNTGTRQTYHSYTDGNIIQRINSNDVSRNLQSGQLVLPYYTTLGSFTGTSVGYLGFDASGNILTVSALSSVGLSMPSAFTVSNSPLTSNGTIAVTGAGLASQYVRGDGTLADFPSGGGGGGASITYYLNGSVNQGTFGGNVYYQMDKTPIIGTGTDFSRGTNGYIAQFITDVGVPNALLIPGGNWNLEFYFSASSGGGAPSFYVELYKYNGTTFTLISSNSATPETITGGTAIDAYFTPLAVPETILAATDRLAIRIYVTTVGKTITLHTENSHLCEIITTFTTGITTLNGLTKQVQYFAVGTSGTDFAISSATDTHTFNLPTASATNRGALSSADWSTFNGKVGGTGVSGQVAYWNGTNSQTGSNNLFWDAANARLGIGTATPAVTLDVRNGVNLYTSGASANSHYLELISTTSTDGYVNFRRSGGANGPAAYYISGGIARFSYDAATGDTILGAYANSPLLFFTNSSERARFTAAGRLLLGTSTEASFLLDVNGTARVSGATSTPALITGTASQTYLALDNTSASSWGSAIDFRANGVGRLYIGTYGSIFGSANYDATILVTGATNAFRINVNNSSSSALLISSTGAATFSSLAGTGSRIVVADASGTLSASAALSGYVTGSGVAGQVAYWDGTSSQTGSNNFTWDNAVGKLNLNSTTQYVSIAANTGLSITNSSTSANGVIGLTGSGFILQGRDGASTAYPILLQPYGGNVGIGTNAPTRRLHVVGTSALFQNAGTFELDLLNTTSGNYLRATAGATDSNIGTIQNIPFSFIMNGSRVGQFTSTNGNLILQNGGTFVDSGYRLDVNGTARVTGNTLISAGNLSIFTTNTPRRINLQVANGSKAAAIGIEAGGIIHSVIGADTSGTDYLQVASRAGIAFYSGSTIGNIVTDPTNEMMRLTTLGRLLLGTTTESTYLLDVNGTARVTDAVTFGSDINLTRASSPAIVSTTNQSIRFSTNGFTGTFDTSGRFTSTIGFRTDGFVQTVNLAVGASYYNTAAPTNGAIIQGNVGIGTTSPAYKMHLFNSGSVTSAIEASGAGADSILRFISPSQYWTITNDGTSAHLTFNRGGTDLIRFSNVGNLLVGTTADQGYRVQITGSGDNMLNVWGATTPSIRLDNAASGATQRFVIGLATATNNFIQGANAGDVCLTTASASAMVFGMWQTSSSSEVMRISTSSNVLIGKNTDSGQKLQVVGKVNLTSLPTSATGLVAGDIWNNGGVLNIV